MSTATSANVRVLELFVELLEARPGRTKTQLRALSGYRGLSDDAFETQFQRDKDALRDAGAQVTIGPGERYRIGRDSFAERIDVSSADRALMSLAAGVWDTDEVFADAIDAKAAAASGSDVHAPPIRLGLRGLGPATAFARGIRERRVVSFTYPGSAGLTERSVEPWALSVQGRALYLWGWDLDRSAQRMFRVSRVTSSVSFIGEAGDASAPPQGQEPGRVSSLVSPLIFVRSDSPARTFLHGYETSPQHSHAPLPRPGWEAMYLEYGEVTSWIGRLLPLGSDVVVLAPDQLREAMLERLNCAARWGGNDA